MNQAIKKAFAHSVPVIAAYVPLGAVWGILWEHASYPLGFGLLFSALVFAGAVQFLGLSLLILGEPIASIFITTLPIAFRNTFYTTAMLDRLPQNKFLRFYSAYSLVDATFVILSSHNSKLSKDPKYSITLAILVHFYWVLGTAIGLYSGSFIPNDVSSLSFTLPALFTVLALEGLEKAKSIEPLIVALICACIAYIISAKYWLLISLALCTLYVILKPTKGKAHAN